MAAAGPGSILRLPDRECFRPVGSCPLAAGEVFSERHLTGAVSGRESAAPDPSRIFSRSRADAAAANWQAVVHGYAGACPDIRRSAFERYSCPVLPATTDRALRRRVGAACGPVGVGAILRRLPVGPSGCPGPYATEPNWGPDEAMPVVTGSAPRRLRRYFCACGLVLPFPRSPMLRLRSDRGSRLSEKAGI